MQLHTAAGTRCDAIPLQKLLMPSYLATLCAGTLWIAPGRSYLCAPASRFCVLPCNAGFGLENPKFYGVLDSVALDEPNLSSAEAGGAPAAPPAAATVGAPPAAAAAKAAVPMSWVTSSVLSEIDKGSSSGATVHVVTERGCWMEFYDNIANILLGKIQQQGQQGRSSAAAPAPDGAPEDAAAAASDLNSLLAVQPEQAAQVIRLIEAAMQSSKEGRTIRLG